MADVLVSVIMGSKSDLGVMQEAAQILELMKIPFEINIISAHRTPERMTTFAHGAHVRQFHAAREMVFDVAFRKPHAH